MSAPFKLIASLTEVDSSAPVENINCTIRVAGKSKTSGVPFREACLFDFQEGTTPVEVTFSQGERALHTQQILMPSIASNNFESEENHSIRFSHDGADVSSNLNLVWINSNLYRSSGSSSPKKGGATSPRKTAGHGPSNVQSRVNASFKPTGTAAIPPTSTVAPQERKLKFTEDELHTYLKKVVDHHLVEAKSKIADDNANVNDCLYVNKFHKITTNDFVNPNAIATSDLSAMRGSGLSPSRTRTNNFDSTSKDARDLSPDKLKTRFGESSRSRSPNNRSGGKTGKMDMTSLLMDNESKRYVNEYKNQLEYLLLVVYSLDLKLKDHDKVVQENQMLRSELQKANEARESLRQSIAETAQSLREEVQKGQKAQSELLADRKGLLDRLKDLNDRIETSQKDNAKNDIVKADLERDHAELLIKYKAMSLFKDQNEQLKRELLECERKRAETTDLYSRRYQEVERGLDEVTRKRDLLQKENNRLMKEIADSTAQLIQERNLNTELQNDANNMKKKLQLTQATIEISEGIQKQRDDLMRELGNLKSHYAYAIEGLENYKNEILNKHKNMDEIDRTNKAEIQALRHNVTQLQGRIDELNNNKIRLEREAIELRSQNVTLEQMVVLREDTVSQVNAANDEVYAVRTEMENLKANLNSSASLIETHNDKIYELEKVVIYLKNVINEKEEYINNLRRVIVELKTKSSVYIPIQDDPLDKRLGDFINTCNDPAKVSQLFLRESEGVYQFGSKRVAVKCENDKVFIRVGGGYLTLEEFLNQHVPIELEKMSRNHPVNILSKNIAVQKTLAGRAVVENEKKNSTSSYKFKEHSPILHKNDK